MKHDEIFNEQLLPLINSIKKRDALIIGGDFNAETKSKSMQEMEYQLKVGKYAKKQQQQDKQKWRVTY